MALNGKQVRKQNNNNLCNTLWSQAYAPALLPSKHSSPMVRIPIDLHLYRATSTHGYRRISPKCGHVSDNSIFAIESTNWAHPIPIRRMCARLRFSRAHAAARRMPVEKRFHQNAQFANEMQWKMLQHLGSSRQLAARTKPTKPNEPRENTRRIGGNENATTRTKCSCNGLFRVCAQWMRCL